ncbi:BON domain-containing protein [Candidatus Bandiella numerosa]|uniref:BON domain-containing protein n=1 Tax=Candidatus Bandiella numerosa TaxID=2570586 RepID=UPI001F263A72|nr:BON domain-containing protein [Candidatus Bandiella numerosa]
MNKFLKSFFLCFLLLSMSNCAVIGIATTATTGTIIAEDRSVGDIIDDKSMAIKIRHQYVKNSVDGSLRGVSLEVYEGRVLLVGHVTSTEYKDEAEKLAWVVRGVKEVINDITISEKNEASLPGDVWISTKLRSKFLVNKEVHSVNYKIMVYNKVVYLLGVAETQKELEIALNVAGEVQGVAKVKNYILVKSDIRRES